MFNVFVQERDTPETYSTIANGNGKLTVLLRMSILHCGFNLMCVFALGYFEKHLTRLKERSKDIDS